MSKMIPLGSKIDESLHKAAKVYCVENDLDLIALIDMSIREKINFYPEASEEEVTNIFKG